MERPNRVNIPPTATVTRRAASQDNNNVPREIRNSFGVGLSIKWHRVGYN